MFTSLKDRTVIVTGGSRGIGKAMAQTFAKEGCKVLLTGRNKEAVAAAVEQINADGGIARGLVADVRSRKDMDRMADYALREFGSIDILCANAGIFPQAFLATMTEDDYNNVMDTNVKGMFNAVLACQDYMKQKRRGRIILTSSITGPNTGFPGWSHYGASKAAQLGFMHSAAIELAPYHITVNAVSPGNVLSDGLLEQGEGYIKQMAQSVPLGELGTPFDIANAAMFLASDEAHYITAQNIIIDGGQIWPESLSALEAIREEYE